MFFQPKFRLLASAVNSEVRVEATVLEWIRDKFAFLTRFVARLYLFRSSYSTQTVITTNIDCWVARVGVKICAY